MGEGSRTVNLSVPKENGLGDCTVATGKDTRRAGLGREAHPQTPMCGTRTDSRKMRSVLDKPELKSRQREKMGNSGPGSSVPHGPPCPWTRHHACLIHAHAGQQEK